jgi:alpha-tubulin suppressor-like RCC1 family protein
LVLAAVVLVTSSGCDTGADSPNAPLPPPAAPQLHLAVIGQPASEIASGATFSPAVRVAIQDANGNTVTSATASISVALNSPTAVLGGTLTRVPVNGIATFDDLTVDKTGEYTLTYTAPRMPNATTRPFTVIPGEPRSLTFVTEPPTVVLSGSVIDPPVAIVALDANANRVATSSLRVTITLMDTSRSAVVPLRGTVARELTDGGATFAGLSADTVGPFVLTASAPGLTGARSDVVRFVRGRLDVPLASITVGLDHTCGLTAAGVAYCWGANGFGQLGDGSLVSRATPTLVAGGLTFTDLSAGGGGYEEDVSFTCGVTPGGDAYCWGGSFRGALGDGSTNAAHNTPVRVAGGLKFRSISAGGAHACGVAVSGVVYCWGSNTVGELGVGDLATRTTPTPVPGTDGFTMVVASDFHTCGMRGSATYCWGAKIGATGLSLTPSLVSTNLSFMALGAGTEHSCGLVAGGPMYCWGDNRIGQLGNGSREPSATPVAVSGLTFSAIATKGYTTCGISGDAAYCWGWNELGQLGIGYATPREASQQTITPARVAGFHVFSSISVGVWHTCALTKSGVAYCWGFNSDGQLGNDSRVNSAVPVPVS